MSATIFVGLKRWEMKKYLVFWQCKSSEQDIKTLSSAHKHRKLTKFSFREGKISSTLFSIIFGTFVARDCSTFCRFKTRSHMMGCGLCKKVAKNATDTAL
jgi:hypothetical protein